MIKINWILELIKTSMNVHLIIFNEYHIESGLVAFTELPPSMDTDFNGVSSANGVVSSSESSRSSSLERKRRQGARVTLDAEGKVVYSSESLRRRKGAHTTFEPGPNIRPEVVQPGRSDSSAFRPSPIGFSSSPESKTKSSAIAREAESPKSPPPYRPAPTPTPTPTPVLIRTQPDGDAADERSTAGSPGTMISRSDSYRMANEELSSSGSSPFQRNDSYRMANQRSRSDAMTSVKSPALDNAASHKLNSPSSPALAPLNGLSVSAVNGTGARTAASSSPAGNHLKPNNVNRPSSALTAQFLSGHLRYLLPFFPLQLLPFNNINQINFFNYSVITDYHFNDSTANCSKFQRIH